MADVKWIKIVTDVFDDEKILLIEGMPDADSLIVIWFKLLCLAGRQNNSGVFMMNGSIPYTDEMLSIIFRRPVNTVRLALNIFEKYGMIEILNGTITIPNWDKHQNIEGLEKVREQTKSRVSAHRRKQLGLCNATVTECNVTSNVTVTQCNAIEENREEEIREDKKRVIKGNPPYPLAEFNFSSDMEMKIKEWLIYKTEKKDKYECTGFKNLLTVIKRKSEQYSDEAVIKLIDDCMSNNWKGIIWERIEKTKSAVGVSTASWDFNELEV